MTFSSIIDNANRHCWCSVSSARVTFDASGVRDYTT